MNFENLKPLRQALLEISSECSKHTYCYDCPLQRTKDGTTVCGIIGDRVDVGAESKAPRHWKVISEIRLMEE